MKMAWKCWAKSNNHAAERSYSSTLDLSLMDGQSTEQDGGREPARRQEMAGDAGMNRVVIIPDQRGMLLDQH
jgi:hypothetical protein